LVDGVDVAAFGAPTLVQKTESIGAIFIVVRFWLRQRAISVSSARIVAGLFEFTPKLSFRSWVSDGPNEQP
jgi:hypothetical protein